MTLAVFKKHALCQLLFCVVAREAVVGVGRDDREASGLRNEWTETKTEREMQLHALVKGKVTPCVTSSLCAATLVTMEMQLMNTCTKNIAVDHSMSVVQKVHGVCLCLQPMLSLCLSISNPLCFLLHLSLSLLFSLFFTSFWVNKQKKTLILHYIYIPL